MIDSSSLHLVQFGDEAAMLSTFVIVGREIQAGPVVHAGKVLCLTLAVLETHLVDFDEVVCLDLIAPAFALAAMLVFAWPPVW